MLTNRTKYIETGVPLQIAFENGFSKLPEFDFYRTSPDGSPKRFFGHFVGYTTSMEIKGTKLEVDNEGLKESLDIEFDFHEMEKPKAESHFQKYMEMVFTPDVQKLFAIKTKFITTRDEAKALEKYKNYEKAVELYEWLIAHQYPMHYAYERLIIIYSKFKLIAETIELLKEGISFLYGLRQKQIDYIMKIAEKYNVLDYCTNRIIDKQKVFYYGGSFELYNPFPIIKKWEDKLEKLTHAKR